MKKIITIGLFACLAIILIQSCKKTKLESPQIEPSYQQAPITGLVVIPPITSMAIMLNDSNYQTQIENENMDIAARAFQLIACDPDFINAIGGAVNTDLEFDVLDFLNNNTTYLQTIQSWMYANNYNMQDVLVKRLKLKGE